MAVYDFCMFFNENDIYEIRLNQYWDFVDKFIVVEAGETHTGFKKSFNFDLERFKKFQSKIVYIKFDSFEEEMANYPYLDCRIGRMVHGNHYDWARDHFQANYIVKVLKDIQADPKDIILVSSADEIVSREGFNEALSLFNNEKTFVGYHSQHNGTIIEGIRPMFGFHMYMYVYKFNLLRFKDIVVGMITEVGNFDKVLPATARSLSLTTHPHIKNGGWHLTYMDSGDGDKVMLKHHSWAHARDPGGIDGKRRIDTATKEESLELLYKEHPVTEVPIAIGTHPEYIVNNVDKFKNYIYNKEKGTI